jgi:hypothetical protein
MIQNLLSKTNIWLIFHIGASQVGTGLLIATNDLAFNNKTLPKHKKKKETLNEKIYYVYYRIMESQ